jgi:nucleotide-binding universal stress UspA family protein
MDSDLSKLLIVAVDGSENSLKSLDYLGLIYDPVHNLEVVVLYVLPTPPQILVADKSSETRFRLLNIEEKNIEVAGRILGEARSMLIKRGFEEERIMGVHRKKQVGVALDICRFAEDKRADAVIISSRGRSRLETFFSGEVASKLLEHCWTCPVWVVDAAVNSRKVLVAMDSSENALRAAEHAGFMLSGTDSQVTLFHSKRHLRRFLPQEIIDAAPELEELWKHKAAEHITPYMKKAKDALIQAGLAEELINTKVVDGSRSAAADILKEARDNNFGTIVLGRKGHSGVKEFFMGSIASKVLQDHAGMAVWIVH